MKFVLTFAALLSASLAVPALADAPDYVRVRSLSHAGSGCPAGTVATDVSPDGSSVAFLFDSFVAEVGPGVSIREKRKNCQINLDLDFSGSWSYTLAAVDGGGYIHLERGVRGLQQTKYYFQGSAATGVLSTSFTGPTSRNYRIRDSIGVNSQVWSPCGARRALNLNLEVRLDNSANNRGVGLITFEAPNRGNLFEIKWRRC